MSHDGTSKGPGKRQRGSSNKISSKRKATTAPFALNPALASYVECLAENWEANKDYAVSINDGKIILIYLTTIQ
jgi:hypothetical protein